jgi:hypothetical protein
MVYFIKCLIVNWAAYLKELLLKNLFTELEEALKSYSFNLSDASLSTARSLSA